MNASTSSSTIQRAKNNEVDNDVKIIDGIFHCYTEDGIPQGDPRPLPIHEPDKKFSGEGKGFRIVLGRGVIFLLKFLFRFMKIRAPQFLLKKAFFILLVRRVFNPPPLLWKISKNFK